MGLLRESLLDIFNVNNTPDTSSVPDTSSLPSDTGDTGNTANTQTQGDGKLVPTNVQGNARTIMTRLMQDLGWPNWSAAAMLGVMKCESGVKPESYNKGEKNGTNLGSSATYGHSKDKEPFNGKYAYGAGLIQWTFYEHKIQSLLLIGMGRQQAEALVQGAGIESLPLDTQIKMVEADMTQKYPKLNQALKQAPNVTAATELICYNYVGGSYNSGSLNTKAQQRYDRSPGKFQKRLNYAQSFLQTAQTQTT